MACVLIAPSFIAHTRTNQPKSNPPNSMYSISTQKIIMYCALELPVTTINTSWPKLMQTHKCLLLRRTNKWKVFFFFFVDKRFNHLASSLPDFRAFHRINSIDTGRVIRNCRRKKRSSIYIKFMSPSANDGANHQKYASLLREPIAEFKIVGGPSFDTSTTSITPNH